MSDLNRFHQRLAPPRLNEIKRFREVGVSPEALSAPELPARADVVFHDDRPLFDFADDAVFVDPISLSFWVSRSSSVTCGDIAIVRLSRSLGTPSFRILSSK
jgi:hypothetical protein